MASSEIASDERRVWQLPLVAIEHDPQSISSEPLAARHFDLDSIDVYTNTGCNRRCNHCFLSDGQLSDKNIMSPGMVDGIIDWAKDEGSSIEEITLLGGEFALHPYATDILRKVDDAGLLARIVTNGSEPFRRLLDNSGVVGILQKSRVAVSLESSDAQVNDTIRGRGAFQDALLAIEDLGKREVPFDINCTVMRTNQDQVPELLELAESMGADRVNLHWFSRVGRATNIRSDTILGKQLSSEEWLNTVTVASQWRTIRPNSAMVVDCELGYQYDLPGQDVAMCAVRQKTNLQFAPDGSVTACGLLMDKPELSGYIFREGQLFRRAGDSELAQAEDGQACNGCPIRPTVLGIATLCIYNRLAQTE